MPSSLKLVDVPWIQILGEAPLLWSYGGQTHSFDFWGYVKSSSVCYSIQSIQHVSYNYRVSIYIYICIIITCMTANWYCVLSIM